jgi:hypothetical protein
VIAVFAKASAVIFLVYMLTLSHRFLNFARDIFLWSELGRFGDAWVDLDLFRLRIT